MCRDIKSVFLESTSVHLGSWSNYLRPALAVPFAFSWNSYDTVITKDQTRSIFKVNKPFSPQIGGVVFILFALSALVMSPE